VEPALAAQWTVARDGLLDHPAARGRSLPRRHPHGPARGGASSGCLPGPP
jgi:hypothetical protein